MITLAAELVFVSLPVRMVDTPDRKTSDDTGVLRTAGSVISRFDIMRVSLS
jgi:hypothetical protein